MTELVLVRHGRTNWNDQGRYQGQDGEGLNQLGREQAQTTARTLVDGRVDAIYSSDLARALDTAQIIAGALALPVHTDVRLREIHQGLWQGMLFDDIQRNYGDVLKRFRSDPAHNSPPGGETLTQLATRFFSALDDIAAAHRDGRVVVVTHKLPIAIVRCVTAGRPPSDVWDAIPDNAQALTFDWPLSFEEDPLRTWLASPA